MRMDAITFRNNRGATFGVADGTAFLTKPGVAVDGDVSAESLRRANAETFPCQDLHEARLHEDGARTVTLVVKNGIRPTDVSTMWIETDDETAQRDFVAAVVGRMRPTTETRTSSLATELLGPAIVAAVVALLGGIVVSMASDIANGTQQPNDRVGRAGGIARLSAAIAGALGTSGSIALFGLLMLCCAAWLVAVIRGRHAVVRWRVA
jgi:hypothetical protein